MAFMKATLTRKQIDKEHTMQQTKTKTFDARDNHSMDGYGIPSGPPQQIAMLVYPQMTALDLVGPQTILSTLTNVKVHLVWKEKSVLMTDTGIPIQATATFDEVPDNLTVLFVPGGGLGMVSLLEDDETLAFLRKKAKTAKYVTSVCTGSLILGAAGLLKGYKATCHWSVHEMLTDFGAKPVKQRVVFDRNRITGAGVTAGIDFALALTAKLRNDKYAKALQLSYEYDPKPPFDAGNVAKCPPDIVTMLRMMYDPLKPSIRASAKKRMKAG
jgi:cyclohexyl-isocyanide hydratase